MRRDAGALKQARRSLLSWRPGRRGASIDSFSFIWARQDAADAFVKPETQLPRYMEHARPGWGPSCTPSRARPDGTQISGTIKVMTAVTAQARRLRLVPPAEPIGLLAFPAFPQAAEPLHGAPALETTIGIPITAGTQVQKCPQGSASARCLDQESKGPGPLERRSWRFLDACEKVKSRRSSCSTEGPSRSREL